MKSGSQISVSHFCAESEGFEPPDPLRSTVFKTAAFDHSANSPIYFPQKGNAKVRINSKLANYFFTFSSSLAKNLYWKSNKYTAPQLTQASAKLKIPPNRTPG